MPLAVNLRHLEARNLRLQGQLTVEELDLDTCDEVIQVAQPLHYDLEAQKLPDGLLVQGRLSLTLHCQCVRCLKSFDFPLLVGNWTCLMPWQGEEAAEVVNDCVDLTPRVREDILLEFPQHPLCNPDCAGLAARPASQPQAAGSAQQGAAADSAWAELNKLRF